MKSYEIRKLPETDDLEFYVDCEFQASWSLKAYEKNSSSMLRDMFNIVRDIGEKDCQQKIKNVLGVK